MTYLILPRVDTIEESKTSPTGHATLLRRWINVNDVVSTSQQHNHLHNIFTTSEIEDNAKVCMTDDCLSRLQVIRFKLVEVAVIQMFCACWELSHTSCEVMIQGIKGDISPFI